MYFFVATLKIQWNNPPKELMLEQNAYEKNESYFSLESSLNQAGGKKGRKKDFGCIM